MDIRTSLQGNRATLSLSALLIGVCCVLAFSGASSDSPRMWYRTGPGGKLIVKRISANWGALPPENRVRTEAAFLQAELIAYKHFEGVRPASCGQFLSSRYHVFQLFNPYTSEPLRCSSPPTAGNVDYAPGENDFMILTTASAGRGGAATTKTWRSGASNPQGVESLDWAKFFARIFAFKIYDRQYESFCDLYWRRPRDLAELEDPAMIPQPRITDPRTGRPAVISSDPAPAPFKFYIDVATGRFISYDANGQMEPQTESAKEVFGQLGKSSLFVTGAPSLPLGLYEAPSDRPLFY